MSESAPAPSTAWEAFLHAWLAAVLTVGLIPLGALAALMTYGLTGGGWGRATVHVWRAMAATLPLFIVALVPLLFGLDALFPWTQSPELLPEVVRKKLLYLNVPFLLIRLGLYLLIWVSLAWLLGAWSERTRGLDSPSLCAAGLIAMLYSLAFFGFDWVLSLEPKFYTDVFGLWLAITAAGAAGAVALLTSLQTSLQDDDPTHVARRADLAALWLAVLLGWAFLAFSQYIVIWSGNMPHEIEWYMHREESVWRVMSWAVFFLYFGLPFLLLMSRRGRRSRRTLTCAAVGVLSGYALQIQWWVLPAAAGRGRHLLWLGPAALIILAVAFTALFRRRLAASGAAHD